MKEQARREAEVTVAEASAEGRRLIRDAIAEKERLLAEGAELLDEIRPTPFERFFFREPVNGYFFEIVDADRAR